jgi:hypothetical protein
MLILKSLLIRLRLAVKAWRMAPTIEAAFPNITT